MTKELSSKSNLLLNVYISIFGIINLIMYIIFNSLNMVNGGVSSYINFIIYFICIWLILVAQILFRLKFKLHIILCYQSFLIVAIIGGCIWRGYDLPIYDKVVHLASGILFALIFYELFTQKKENDLTKFWLFMCVFAFAMMIGGVWEIFEYIFDGITGQNMQRALNFMGREALKDTMLDMISDFVGGLVGATIAVFIERKKTKVPSTNI